VAGLPGWLQPLLILALAAAGVAVVALRGGAARPLRERLRRQWLPAAILAFMAILSLAAVSLAGTGANDGSPSVRALAVSATVAANAAMLALGVWLIGTGLRENRGAPFAYGVGYLLLWAWLRYIDLFSSFGGMLGAALMFFLCGAVLVAVALYWRRRREVFNG
jgi:hypothetical protein